MDYSFFDSSYDGVFVLNEEKTILYCNDAGALLCASSVRRLTRGQKIYEVIEFSNSDLFPHENGSEGRDAPVPWTEIDFSVRGKDKSGKVQISIQPFMEGSDRRWVVTLHDVTLEETLHRKYQGELEQKEGVILQLQEAQAQLEAYSKNLEKMVEERTSELRSANQMLSAIMDSLGQGFLVFSPEGTCSDIYTKACLDILEVEPAQKPIWEVLALKPEGTDQFKMWMQASFSESLPFESMKDLAPQQFHHSQGNYVTLDYFPIRNDEGQISNMVVVATDKTQEHRANLALEKEKKYAEMILKLVTSRDQFSQFLRNSEQTLSDVEKLIREPKAKFDGDQIFRTLHTLEGEAGAFSVESIRLASRHSQNLLEELKDVSGDAWETKRQDLLRSLGELSGAYKSFYEENAALLALVKIGGERIYEFAESYLDSYYEFLRHHQVAPAVLKEYDLRILRQPLESLMRHFESLAQNVAARQGKQLAPFEFEMGDVRVKADFLEPVLSSLVHAFRNAVDHGIEPPEDREMLGKSPQGHIKIISRYLENKDWARIEILDDGGGIDGETLLKKAKEKIPGLKTEGLSESDILQLVFHPGFSSREEVSEFSGRGVGMDAIRYEVLQIGGRVWVESEVGAGTRLCLEIPIAEVKPAVAKTA